MYQISVPVKSQNFDRCGKERILCDLKKVGAKRVFLTLATYEPDPSKRNELLNTFRENAAFLKKEGFEIGAWLWTFNLPENTLFSEMKSLDGKVIQDVCCPADPDHWHSK